MPASAATLPLEPSSTPTPAPSRRGIGRHQVAGVARRSATELPTAVPLDAIVQQTVARFDDTFGERTCPLDLEGWIRRTVREIVRLEESIRPRTGAGARAEAELVQSLERLAAPVRSPALAKQRKLLLRRISELIGGPERRVVLAMITEQSLDRVADQLRLSPVDVARLHRRGLQRLQQWLDHDQELAQQLRDASRQPKRARTSR